MIRTVSGIVLLILHLTVCILIWAGIRSGMLKVKKYLIIQEFTLGIIRYFFMVE